MRPIKLKAIKGTWPLILYFVCFMVWIFFFPSFERWLTPWLPARTRVLTRTPLYMLALQHMIIAGLSTAFAVITALTLGIVMRLLRRPELKEIILAVSAIGQTIPSVAIIALAVPLLGYGNGPCIFALYVYAILPIIRNVIIGFESTDDVIVDAGVGMGMSRLQILRQVDLPLAKPIILTGIRMALIINISAATIGATVGAGGFGVPIIAGIRVYNPVMVIQGSVPVILMAFFVDRLLRSKQDEKVAPCLEN